MDSGIPAQAEMAMDLAAVADPPPPIIKGAVEAGMEVLEQMVVMSVSFTMKGEQVTEMFMNRVYLAAQGA